MVPETVTVAKPSWSEALRALVEDAFDRRDAGDRDGFAAACKQIVRARLLWPLAEVELAVARAEEELERRVRAVEREPWLVHDLLPGLVGTVEVAA